MQQQKHTFEEHLS